MSDEEKYFVFTENCGMIEAVYWCKTLKEAEEKAKQRKEDFLEEAKQVHIGKLLT